MKHLNDNLASRASQIHPEPKAEESRTRLSQRQGAALRLLSMSCIWICVLGLWLGGCANPSPRDGGTDQMDAQPNFGSTDADISHDGGMGPDAVRGDAPRPDAGPFRADTSDYAHPAYWLCHPEKNEGPCHDNLDVTQIDADGRLEVIPHRKAEQPTFDCFYVYPTCSLDSAPNSDFVAEEENAIAHLQIARFQSMCRVFAPIYRQITIGGLVSRRDEADEDMAYNDVEQAFLHYLEHHNEGRGLVFIGHSQGSMMLIRLLQTQFDSQPELRDKLISAYLIGFSVEVPEDEDVGGTFENIPLCSSADQFGCIVTYAAYRETDPPEAGALFGIAQEPGMEAGCTDPGGLLNDQGTLHSIFPSTIPLAYENLVIGNVSPFADPSSAPMIETGFFSVPGLASGECRRRGDYHYLSIEVNADPNDPRADDIGGDFVLPGWGLHLVDVNLAMGQLDALMRVQSQAYENR